jgi:hypothetical protein
MNPGRERRILAINALPNMHGALGVAEDNQRMAGTPRGPASSSPATGA